MARVLVIGDTHCPAMRNDYVDFLKDIHKAWACDRVVHIGDLVDWQAISYHEKSPSCSNAFLEFEQAMVQVQQLYKAFPKADWMIGNHDALSERQAVSAGLPPQVLRSYTDMWQVPGWKAHARFSKFKLDGVIYSHGDAGKGGMMAALKQARDNFRSTVIGHFHAEAGVWFGANEEFRYFGMNAGTGVDSKNAAMNYGKKYPRKPVNGCGVVIDGTTAVFEPMKLASR